MIALVSSHTLDFEPRISEPFPRPSLSYNIFFHWQIAQQFVVQDKFTQKTRDLNPKCKEGITPIMQLGV